MQGEAATTQNQPLDAKLEELFHAGVHFGYAKTRRHPGMRPYIAGVKSNIEIFNVEKVSDKLQAALAFIEKLGAENAPIMWVGTKPAAVNYIEQAALELGHPFVNNRWLGGTLTNNKNIKDRIAYWQDLVMKQKTGELSKYTKQEQLMIQRKIDRLHTSFNGLLPYTTMPKAMFIIDPKEEENALAEADNKKIPVIALLNTDCNPGSVLYPIPGNDNAPKSIEYIINKVKEAYLNGRKQSNNG